MTDFKTWDRATLEQFAREAADRLHQQEAEIEALRIRIDVTQADLRLALDAYRRAVRLTV